MKLSIDQAGKHLFPRPTMRESAECGLNMPLHSKGDLHQGLLTTLGIENSALSRNKKGAVSNGRGLLWLCRLQ